MSKILFSFEKFIHQRERWPSSVLTLCSWHPWAHSVPRALQVNKMWRRRRAQGDCTRESPLCEAPGMCEPQSHRNRTTRWFPRSHTHTWPPCTTSPNSTTRRRIYGLPSQWPSFWPMDHLSLPQIHGWT